MNESEVLEALEEHDALRHGHFQLSSGMHTDTYVQCAQVLQWPGLAERLGHELGDRTAGLQPTCVLGPALGGIIIAHEVARFLGVRMVFCERVADEMTLRRGFSLAPGERVLVVEDVVTTGGSQRQAIELARREGGLPVGVASIVDRSEGVSFGVQLTHLLKLQARHWRAEDCPGCESNDPLSSPGSRRAGA